MASDIQVVPIDALSQGNIQDFDCLIIVWTSEADLQQAATAVPPLRQIVLDLSAVRCFILLQGNVALG